VSAAAAVTLVLWAAPGYCFQGPTPPYPPAKAVDTTYTRPTGRTIAVRGGGDFQGALEEAQPGDVIALQAGAVFRGNFRLPRKARSGWVVIRSSAADKDIPVEGVRITPAFSGVMAKLVTPNSVPVIQTAPGASGYRFIGIEFTVSENVPTLRQIVAFGGTQSHRSDVPGNLILDRCYVHGHRTGNVFRGVLLNSASSAVVDSHISEIHVAGHDSQAILGYNGPGPFKISNNFLEAAGENIMFGGGDPQIRDLVPSDIEIRNNHLFKPLRWRQNDPGFSGPQWTVKNLLELKNAQRVLIEGNVLENVWPQAQGGTAVVFTPRNGGSAPWSVVQDVMFRNNIVKNATGGFGGQSADDSHASRPMKRIAIVNNLWLAIDRIFFAIAAPSVPAEDVRVDHNTAVPIQYFSYDIDAAAAPALVRSQFTNNLSGFGVYGVKFPRTGEKLAQWLPGAIVAKNALVKIALSEGRRVSEEPWTLDVAKFLVLPSPIAAGLQRNGRLTREGPLKGAGTDGKDIGVDIEELERATRWSAVDSREEGRR
jgi:hypothetical protein